MTITLSILGVIVFLAGSYFMGNAFGNTFNSDLVEKLLASFVGMFLWIAIGIVLFLCVEIYLFIHCIIS